MATERILHVLDKVEKEKCSVHANFFANGRQEVAILLYFAMILQKVLANSTTKHYVHTNT